jgi:hypothetical protein
LEKKQDCDVSATSLCRDGIGAIGANFFYNLAVSWASHGNTFLASSSLPEQLLKLNEKQKERHLASQVFSGLLETRRCRGVTFVIRFEPSAANLVRRSSYDQDSSIRRYPCIGAWHSLLLCFSSS